MAMSESKRRRSFRSGNERIAQLAANPVIAEQVEDQEALDTVKRMGIDFAQGFIVGRPQPLSMVPAI